MLKMWSHLLLFSKFLQVNSSPFNGDPHDIVWERKISLYRFRNRFAVYQQKPTWFERDVCVSCASYITAIDNIAHERLPKSC